MKLFLSSKIILSFFCCVFLLGVSFTRSAYSAEDVFASNQTGNDSQQIKAVLFDAFPIFDPRSAFAIIKEEFPEKGDELRQLWFQKIFSYTWLRTLGENQYQDFWSVMEEALKASATSMNLELTAEKQTRMMNAFRELSVWADVKPVLTELAENNIRIGFLSNMTEEMLRANLKHNSIERLFDAVISTDQTQAFKPSPKAYQLGLDAFGFEKEEIVFVAFAGWDAAGAKWFGYPTVWVNRLKASPEELNAKPDYEGNDLNAVTEFLKLSNQIKK